MAAPIAIRTGLALTATALLTTGCAHVGQDDFDAGLADLRAEMRSEMQEGDQAVARRLGGRIDGVEARMAALENDLATLEREFGVTVQRLETALRFQAPVHFGFDDARLSGDAPTLLDRFGDVVARYYPGAVVTVEGFTDPAGSEAYNLRLGQRRADAVRDYLVAQAGLSDEQVRAVSYGEDTRRLVAPGASGPGSQGWQNRRVVLVIEHGGGAPVATVTEPMPST